MIISYNVEGQINPLLSGLSGHLLDISDGIGWIKAFDCTENSGPWSAYLPPFNDKAGFINYAQYAVSLKIVPKDGQSDYEVQTVTCSNPVFNLNNGNELSFVTDINTGSLIGVNDLNNWIGSSVAKDRLYNTCTDDQAPRSLSTEGFLFHCCGRGGIHLYIPQSGTHCRFNSWSNVNNKPGIQVWLGFDADLATYCSDTANSKYSYTPSPTSPPTLPPTSFVDVLSSLNGLLLDTNDGIGWVKAYDCTENNGPWSAFLPPFNTKAGFINYAKYAISLKIVPKDGQSDYEVQTVTCSNPVFNLNNGRELSFLTDITTGFVINQTDLNNWIGSSVAKDRLRNTCLQNEGALPRQLSNEGWLFHCCGRGGIHLYIPQSGNNCRFNSWSNDNNKPNIQVWLGFDSGLTTYCGDTGNSKYSYTNAPTSDPTSQPTTNPTLPPTSFGDVLSSLNGLLLDINDGIGWVKAFDCTEQNGPWSAYLPPFNNKAGFINYAKYAISLKIVPSDGQSDYEVQTVTCSNPVFNLNNGRELSFLTNITTGFVIGYNDYLNDWIGSSTATYRLYNTCLQNEGALPRQLSAEGWIFHCCGRGGIHLNIPQSGNQCRFNSWSNENNKPNIQVWLGFDANLTTYCGDTGNSKYSYTNAPTSNPTSNPTPAPTSDPTPAPTTDPTPAPTTDPTTDPTLDPTIDPTKIPTQNPTILPSAITKAPTNSPSSSPPTLSPSIDPTNNPTKSPSDIPSFVPTGNPSVSPTSKLNSGSVDAMITTKTKVDNVTDLTINVNASNGTFNQYEVIRTVNASLKVLLNTDYRLTADIIKPNKSISLLVNVYDDDNALNEKEIDSQELTLKIQQDLNKDSDIIYIVDVAETDKSQQNMENMQTPFEYERINETIIGFCLFLGLIVSFSFIDAKWVRINDYHRIGALIIAILQLMDMIYDCLFAIKITYDPDFNDDNLLFILLVLSISFLLIPTFTTLIQLHFEMKDWKRNDEVSQWIFDNTVLLYIISALCGSSFVAVRVCCSNLFGLPYFDMPLTQMQKASFFTKRIYSSVMLENIPQLIIQTVYLFMSSTEMNNYDIVYTSMAFSVLSISISILSMSTKKDILKSSDYVQIEVDVKGDAVTLNFKQCRNRYKILQEHLSLIFGINKKLIEIKKPSQIPNGLKLHIIVHINNTKAIDINCEKLINDAKNSGKLGQILQEAWSISTIPSIENIKYTKYDSQHRKDNTVMIKAMSEQIEYNNTNYTNYTNYTNIAMNGGAVDGNPINTIPIPHDVIQMTSMTEDDIGEPGGEQIHGMLPIPSVIVTPDGNTVDKYHENDDDDDDDDDDEIDSIDNISNVDNNNNNNNNYNNNNNLPAVIPPVAVTDYGKSDAYSDSSENDVNDNVIARNWKE